MLILDKFFLKYEGGSNWTSTQKKLPSKSPALLGLFVHISSSISKNKILHLDVLPCPATSDHGAPNINVNIPTNKYEIRYKFIKNLKDFDIETYVNGFKTLPFRTEYSFNETDDLLDTLKKLILSVIHKHAPLSKQNLQEHKHPG